MIKYFKNLNSEKVVKEIFPILATISALAFYFWGKGLNSENYFLIFMMIISRMWLLSMHLLIVYLISRFLFSIAYSFLNGFKEMWEDLWDGKI